MTGTYLPDDLEATLNAAIDQGVEGSKLDFKREINLKGEALGEFLVDILSIVNTDDDYFDGAGYLIIGFDNERTFHGLPADFDRDKFSASLNQLLSTYVSPHVPVRVVHPLKYQEQIYAAIQIPPSIQQPHMMIRQAGRANPGDWWVRKGDTKAKAGPEDFVRVLGKQVVRHTHPLQTELNALQGLHTNLTARLDQLLMSQAVHAGLPAIDAPGVSTAAKIRAEYGTRQGAVLQALNREVLTFVQAFKQFAATPAVKSGLKNGPTWMAAIAECDALTRPVGEALGAAILHGQGELDPHVVTALQRIARSVLVWPDSGTLRDLEQQMLERPMNLLLYTVFAAAIRVSRPEIIRALTDQPVKMFNEDRPWLRVMRTLSRDNDRFRDVLEMNDPAPAYAHLSHVVLGDDSGWLSAELILEDLHQLALQTDLTLSLAYLASVHFDSLAFQNRPAIPNSLFFSEEANTVVREYLRSGAGFLEQATGRDPIRATEQVIAQAQQYADNRRYWIPLTREALEGVREAKA